MNERLLEEAKETDFLHERVLWRKNYFWCGHSRYSYYNIQFVAAMEVIGRYCNPTGNNNSDYHNGIDYIAKQSEVSKSQVKAMSKKMRIFNRYEFKTSRSIVIILNEIIKALKAHESKPEVQRLMYRHTYYRDMIAYTQCSSIRNAARDSGDKRIADIVKDLNGMLDTLSVDTLEATKSNG